MMRASPTFLARKYAQAWFGVHPKLLTMPQIMHLRQLRAFLESNKGLLSLCTVPTVPREQQVAIIQKLCGHFSLEKALVRLIELLVHDHRVWLLPLVLKCMIIIGQQQLHATIFTITSSHTLSAKARTNIEQFLARTTGKNSIYIYTVDPALIAGIRFESDTTVWEYSVRKQLRTLNAVLA